MGRHPTGAARGIAGFVLAASLIPSLAAPTLAADPAVALRDQERFESWSAVRNGDFEERGAPASPPAIPWWRSTHGAAQIEVKGGGSRLRTGPGEQADQPIAAYARLIDVLEITGRVQGTGVLALTDGSGAVARFPLRSTGEDPHAFTITPAEVERELGRAPMPRLTLTLAGTGDSTAYWDDIELWTRWPLPDEADLCAEVVGQLDAIFTTWEERALDVAGPRKTAFVSRSFDVVTGAELYVADSAAPVIALHENLLDALAVHENPRWRAFLERHVEDVLTLALHPVTGLPCGWNPTTDTRIEDVPVEIALAFGYLIDVAREGPQSFRARARAAAVKIGETVLAHGILADGQIAASYVPATGAVNLDVNGLRRLDVVCQLARLAALTGEERFEKPAREALAVLEYTNHWGGAWDEIDPAFDDSFGHFGARAATIALARPDDAYFRRFAVEGLRHFLPLWHDATRFGGNVAADQVRCWSIAADVARLEPTLAARIQPVLADAVDAHVQGEQYGNGAWGDVTIFGFDPRTGGMQVGDLSGTPQNLLNGLSAVYAADVGLRTDRTRALFTAVLRSTVTEYGRPYGFLLHRGESERGGNNAVGSLRVLLGLTTMLRALSVRTAPR